MNSHDSPGFSNIDCYDANLLFDKALTCLQSQNPVSAAQLIPALPNTIPNPFQNLYYTLALCLLKAGRYSEAQQALKNEMSLYSSNILALNLYNTCQAAGVFKNTAQNHSATILDSNKNISSQNKSELDLVIQPEVYQDEFYYTIIELTSKEKLNHILEIGSSSGGGSTEAFVKGLSQNPGDKNSLSLYCMELSKPRFQALKNTYKNYSFVKCYNVSSVPTNLFPDFTAVESFYKNHNTALNQYPLDRVLGWLKQDLEYVQNSNVPQNGIQLIKQENSINKFDMVLIDGSEFTGIAELKEVYGAKWILLDDICVYKNFDNYNQLLKDPNYELFRANTMIRNGYAVFKQKYS